MDPALKQRLVGAVVLVALAVIFLPLLIKGPPPASGAADVPLDLPKAPVGAFETREIPLGEPGTPGADGASGLKLPTPGSTETAAAGPGAAATGADGVDGAGAVPTSGMMPPPTAGGDFAVSFGSYATRGDAARVVSALVASQLPGYQEAYRANGRELHRVRIGPYATRAEAEAARLRAAHVHDRVDSKVLALDTDAGPAADRAGAGESPRPAEATAGQPAAATPTLPKPPKPKPEPSTSQLTPPGAGEPKAGQPAVAAREPDEPAAKPGPAAASVGFAVQIGAFSHRAEAERLRDRARAAGMSAFVEQVPTEQGVLSRVRIGPVADRADAEVLKAQAAARLGLSGQVRPHP